MEDDETPKNKGGRPKGSTTGQAKLRTLKMGPLWDRGQEVAKAQGVTMTALVEEALRRELTRIERHAARETT